MEHKCREGGGGQFRSECEFLFVFSIEWQGFSFSTIRCGMYLWCMEQEVCACMCVCVLCVCRVCVCCVVWYVVVFVRLYVSICGEGVVCVCVCVVRACLFVLRVQPFRSSQKLLLAEYCLYSWVRSST